MAQRDEGFLQAALAGYEAEKRRLEQAIVDIQKRLGKRGYKPLGGGEVAGPFLKPAPKKHRISAEGRARIAEAQRRRWAKAKKA